jgi:hypothetical protein
MDLLGFAVGYRANIARQLGVSNVLYHRIIYEGMFEPTDVNIAKSGMHFFLIKNLIYCLENKSRKKFILEIAQWIASKHVISARNKAAKEAKDMCASGQCATALVKLQTAIYLTHLPSYALKAWLLTGGREGVATDWKRGFELAEEGARLGCHHCQGVLAKYYFYGLGCYKNQTQSLELAHKSSEMGSRYGQYTLGEMHHYGFSFGAGGFVHDDTQALAFYRLAAAQGLDAAQFDLGHMYYHGRAVAQDYAEALRLFQLAAAQGHPLALSWLVYCHENEITHS